MEPTKYLEALHDADDGTVFVILEASPGRELRGRRTVDGVRVEEWTRGDSVNLTAEAVSRLHGLAEARLPAAGEGDR